MPRIRKQIRDVMNDLDARAARLRPGSVLILVVVLLVLMALLGTAYLVTSKNERVATRLYSHNVQIDLLVQGVENMAIAAISDTSYQTSNAQYYDDWYTTNNTTLATGAPAHDHSWLAARYPSYMIETLGYAPNGSAPRYTIPKGVVLLPSLAQSIVDNNTTTPGSSGSWGSFSIGNGPNSGLYEPTWTAVSAPLAANTFNEDPRYPYVPTGSSLYFTGPATAAPRPDGVRTEVTPDYVSIGGKNYPALDYYSPYNKTYEQALAASASGNGIADAFLWRLPIGTIDGITYYAAVRIIDNNSAVNVNTANSSSIDFNGTGAALLTTGPNAGFLPGMFPASIGLAELTYSYNGTYTSDTVLSPELTALNLIRCGGIQRPNGIAVAAPPAPSSPVDNSGNARTDFNYVTEGDALWMGLGRRLNNPGYSSGSTQFKALPPSDAAALAHRFDLPNPNASPTLTEQSLVNSTWNYAGIPGPSSAGMAPNFPSTPWDPSATANWFAQYGPEPTSNSLPRTNGSLNRRPYFTTQNATSNLMPSRSLNTATTGLPAGEIASVLPYMVPPSPNANGNPSTNYLNGVAPKISLNTADVSLQDVVNPPAGAGPKGPTLWFGFYNAMLDAIPPSPTAYAALTTNKYGFAQFRSPIRDVNGFQTTAANAVSYLSGPETVLLRSLLAAVNAKDLRDSGDNVETVGGNIPTFPAANLGGSVQMHAFGTERQVYITEIYANTQVTAPQTSDANQGNPNPYAGMKNPKGYVAVELYNPYDYPVDLAWWSLVVVHRTSMGATTPQIVTVSPITNFQGFGRNGDGQSTVIPPKGYMVLENYPTNHVAAQSGNDATYRPQQAYMPPLVISGQTYYVSNLHEVLDDSGQGGKGGGELILLRQVNAHGQGAPNPDPILLGTNVLSVLPNMAPDDSFDFSGITTTIDVMENPVVAMHYVRANPGGNSAATTPWQQTMWRFVYPGRWDPSAYKYTDAAGTSHALRQEGIQTSIWKVPDPTKPVSAGHFDPWVDAAPSPAIALGAADPQGSYVNNFPAIQLNNTDMGGPNKLFSPGAPQNPYMYPFGGFARVGDVLQVPFMGAYTILNATGTQVIEINPVTRDCACADDNDSLSANSDDAIEQVGRFCPLLAGELTNPYNPSSSPAATPLETVVPVGTAAAPGNDFYGWAAHVMDYFTTLQNPNDDYLPNVDPNVYIYGPWTMVNTGGTGGLYSYPAGNFAGVQAVANTTNPGKYGPNNGAEDSAPVQGLININTANWRTLATIPWIPTNTSVNANANTYNQAFAKSIVTFRNTYGPFKTIFDLNKVPFSLVNGAPYTTANVASAPNGAYSPQMFYGDPRTTDYGPAAGDISPLWQTTPAQPSQTSDQVINDFETRFGMIIRVSNLITTRSDTFTVYVLVQGWSGVGTATPSLVVQRRAAFIADRSQTTPANPSLNITPVQAY